MPNRSQRRRAAQRRSAGRTTGRVPWLVFAVLVLLVVAVALSRSV